METSVEPTSIQGDKLKSSALFTTLFTLGGPVYAIVIGGLCVVFGMLLTITVVGAIIGIPMIIGGIIAIFVLPFISPFLGLGVGLSSKKGACPVCQNRLRLTSWQKAITCSACKSRLLVRNKQLITVNHIQSLQSQQ